MAPPPFPTVAIYGPGLLGGSIALAVRRAMPDCELRLWARRQQALGLAKEKGIEHTYSDPLKAAEGAQLIILATPIGAFEDLTRRILPAISRQAIVTDVGSVKSYVHRTTGALLYERGRTFIGSHPMAGAETQGFEHARADLLQGATVAVTNPHGAGEEEVQRLERFWETLGARTYRIDPHNHDRTVARISHMPHIMAALCARNATQGNVPMTDLQRLAATGFRDTTRVSSGASGMWAEILWENDVAIRDLLHSCLTDLQTLITLLEEQDRTGLREWLEKARAARETILQQRDRQGNEDFA